MKRTTIMADETLLLELKHRAKREGRNVSELIREALRQYCKKKEKKKSLSIVGIGKSGRKDVSEKVEEILREELRKDI